MFLMFAYRRCHAIRADDAQAPFHANRQDGHVNSVPKVPIFSNAASFLRWCILVPNGINHKVVGTD